jgi:hypothetical protein
MEQLSTHVAFLTFNVQQLTLTLKFKNTQPSKNFPLPPHLIEEYVRLTTDLDVAIANSRSINSIPLCSLRFNVSLLLLLLLNFVIVPDITKCSTSPVLDLIPPSHQAASEPLLSHVRILIKCPPFLIDLFDATGYSSWVFTSLSFELFP